MLFARKILKKIDRNNFKDENNISIVSQKNCFYLFFYFRNFLANNKLYILYNSIPIYYIAELAYPVENWHRLKIHLKYATHWPRANTWIDLFFNRGFDGFDVVYVLDFHGNGIIAERKTFCQEMCRRCRHHFLTPNLKSKIHFWSIVGTELHFSSVFSSVEINST